MHINIINNFSWIDFEVSNLFNKIYADEMKIRKMQGTCRDDYDKVSIHFTVRNNLFDLLGYCRVIKPTLPSLPANENDVLFPIRYCAQINRILIDPGKDNKRSVAEHLLNKALHWIIEQEKFEYILMDCLFGHDSDIIITAKKTGFKPILKEYLNPWFNNHPYRSFGLMTKNYEFNTNKS
jgi:hypothetical protein